MEHFAPHWTEAQQNRLCQLLEMQDKGECWIGYWNSDAYDRPANHVNGTKERAKVGLIQEVLGPLELCSGRALHASKFPHKWKGAKCWMVALHGEKIDSDDKAGALKREIIGEILPEEAIFDCGLALRLGAMDLVALGSKGANLSGADLSRAYLYGANLSGADLYGANLSGADLYGANLYGARRDSNPPNGWKIESGILIKK